MTALITLEDVEKVYGEAVQTWALKPTDLTLNAGELVVILGPSGSGKSTLLNLLGGLDTPTRGQIIVDGVDITRLKPALLADFRRDKVGFVFQFYNLIPSLTARENVEFAAQLSHCEKRVDPVIAAVGLAQRAGHFPSQLSGGEQQRVAIARALVKDPPLLLCDEPTGALDYETGKAILALLERLVYESRKTVLLVTHNGALTAIATRQIHLKDGEIIADTIQTSPTRAEDLVW